MLARFLLAIASLTIVVDGFWREQCSIIQTGRIDPIVSPGKISGHAHKISGGSNIGLNSTYTDMVNSQCTSCEITADKSGYWTPQLYYQHSNGEFEEVPNSGMLIYYLGRGDNVANMKPFPPGFQMLSGDSNVRSYDNTTLTYLNGRPIADRVSFNCLDSSGPIAEQPYMFRTDCDDGLRAQVHFQSCWNGVDLYKSDNSHVAYMSQMDNGACPPGYPIQLVHLFYEVLYSVNSIARDANGTFVFANGDTTGYGFHGDFLNGWNQNVQTVALNVCGANANSNGTIEECPPLALLDDPYFATNCPPRPPLINEPATGTISKLPGCNKVTSGPGRALSTDTSCPAGTTAPSLNSFTPSAKAPVLFNPQPGYTENGWKYLGCANDTVVNGRALSGPSFVNATSMSNQACTAFCLSKNYPYAGTEYSQECYCGLTLPTLSPPSTCLSTPKMLCTGNRTTYCGAPSLLTIWNSTAYISPPPPPPFPSNTTILTFPNPNATSSKKAPPTLTATYYSCVHEPPSNIRALSAAATTSPNMTNNLCGTFCTGKGYTLFGTEYADECYCALTFTPGSSLSSSSTCSTPCPGNTTQYCGAGNLLSVWSFGPPPSSPPPSTTSSISTSTTSTTSTTSPSTTSTTPPPAISGYSYAGCYTDTSTPRALPNSTLTSPNSMTPALCVTLCRFQSYSYAGLENGTDCYCARGLYGGSALAAGGDGACNTPCSGAKGSGSVCGGVGRLGLWVSQGS